MDRLTPLELLTVIMSGAVASQLSYPDPDLFSAGMSMTLSFLVMLALTYFILYIKDGGRKGW